MISCRLQGGLGNMMFQIATTYALALDNDDSCAFSLTDGSFSKAVFERFHKGIGASCYKNNIFKNLKTLDKTPAITYRETTFRYQKIPYYKNMCLDGYFQSEKYFKHRKKDILALFGFSIKKLVTNNVSIHVRRGDYITLSAVHPPCSKEYYREAMSLFPDTTEFVVFSDDLSWCKENLDGNLIFAENSKDYEDLYTMSLCSHNIIANSSFSW